MKTIVSTGIISAFVILLGTPAAQAQGDGRICLSGNCETGSGRLRMPKYGNFEYEGQFEKGKPAGTIKIYQPTGELYYDGDVNGFIPEGQGRLYDKDSGGKAVVIEDGEFKNGYLVNGVKFKPDGAFESSGQYDSTTGKHRSAFMEITYHNKRCTFGCTDLRRGPEGAVFNGKVTIRVREEDDAKSPVLLEAYYTNGILNGILRSWDYDNGVYYFVQYQNGTAREDGLNGGMINRIADDYPVATEVRFSPDAARYFDWPNRILSGTFHFGQAILAISSPSGPTDLGTFVELYKNGNGEAFGPGTSHPGGTTITDNTDGFQIPEGHTEAEVISVINMAKNLVDQTEKRGYDLANIWNGITKSNYTRQRRAFESMQIDMAAAITNFIYKYDKLIPPMVKDALTSRRKKIERVQVPAYVQY